MAKKKLISTKMKIFIACIFLGSILSFSAAGVLLYNSGFQLSNYFDFDNYDIGLFYNNRLNGYEVYTANENLDGVENLTLDFNGYDTYIETYSGSTIELSIENLNGSNSEISNSNPFNISRDNGSLSIKPNTDLNNDLFKHSNFIIKIPYSYAKNLNLNIISGNVSLTNLTLNDLSVKTINADVILNSTTCETSNISTTNGYIDANTFTSKILSLNTVDGNIYFSPLIGEVSLSTISGNASLTLSNSLTKLDVVSTSGEVELTLPSSPNFAVNFSTVSGDLYNSLNDSFASENQENINFNLGNGDNKLNIKTVSGNLSLYN